MPGDTTVSDSVEELRSELLTLLKEIDRARRIKNRQRAETLTKQAARCLVRVCDAERHQRHELMKLLQLD